MKFIIALALVAAVQGTVVPRERAIPLHKLYPRMTGAQWQEVLANQEYVPESMANFKPGTERQIATAGISSFDSKIVGGNNADRGQFPWQVAVTMDGSYFCGGSIISKDWVLTAGHCVDDISSFRLVFGTNTPTGGESGSVAQVSREAILNSAYNSNLLINDIALIRIQTPLTFSQYINPIRLPKRSQASETFAGRTSRVSGWGKTSDGTGGISTTLKWVDLPILPNSECAAVFGGSTVISSCICTSGAGGKGTCNGDSGGPLGLVESDGRTTQIGVVSFVASVGCQLAYPAGYARVTSFLGWIETNSGIVIEA